MGTRSPLFVVLLFATVWAVQGCALKSDLDLTIDELNAVKQRQANLMKQLEIRAQTLAEGQSDLSATQGEFRSEADAISSQVAGLGRRLGQLSETLKTLALELKDLQNTQAMGMGALSGRIDATAEELTERIDTQTAKLDMFATTTSDRVADLAQKGQRRDASLNRLKKDLTALNKKVSTLGKKLTAELASQSKRIDAGAAADGAGGADVAALKKKVDILGKKLPAAVDAQGKKVSGLSKELHDIQSLLSDLNKRLKKLEGR